MKRLLKFAVRIQLHRAFVPNILAAILALAAASCASSDSVEPALPEADDALSAIEAAYQEPAETRHDAVLRAVGLYLRTAVSRNQTDLDRAQAITQAAFASKTLIFPEPAQVNSQNATVVVGLPDGLGVYFYDLQSSPSARPVEVSRWAVHLSNLEVVWQPSLAGVLFYTGESGDKTQAHFALVSQRGQEWLRVWLSDESPDWWITADNASVSVAPDLNSISVIGESPYTTSVFQELAGAPVRRFASTWYRNSTGYTLRPAPGSGNDRRQWLWQAATPSPYATLVEFIERLRASEQSTAANLAASSEVVDNALAFGLAIPEAPYVVVSMSETMISYRGLHGVFVVTFAPPPNPGGKWLITSILPIGAVPPTPTP